MQSVICPKIQIKTDRERSVLILLIESAVSEQSDGIAAFVASVLRAEFTQDTNPRQQQVRRPALKRKDPNFLFGSLGGDEGIRKERSDGIAAFVASVLRAEFTQDTNPRQQKVRRPALKRKDPNFLFGSFGGDEGIRTPDLCVANASLYQLSHAPTHD